MKNEAELKFLHNTCGYWDFPKLDDTKVVDTKYIFIGPCTPSKITKQGYIFKEDQDALEKYKLFKNI